MEGNFQLNINIEGDIADLHCLFRYFKNILPFQLTLISVNKDIFLRSCYRTEKKLLLSEKRNLFRWWHSPSCPFWWNHYELYFPAIAMWYSSSTIMSMKPSVPEKYKISVRQFLKITFIYKKNIFEKYYQRPKTAYFDSETKRAEVNVNVKWSSINKLYFSLHWVTFFKQTHSWSRC